MLIPLLLRAFMVSLFLTHMRFISWAGVCFPIGKGVYRVLNIPEDEAVLLNSREKAPYLICVEVVKCETPRYSLSLKFLLEKLLYPKYDVGNI